MSLANDGLPRNAHGGISLAALDALDADPAGWINASQFERDHAGLRNDCAACGHPGVAGNPLVVSDDGYRVHASHTTDPSSGLYR